MIGNPPASTELPPSTGIPPSTEVSLPGVLDALPTGTLDLAGRRLTEAIELAATAGLQPAPLSSIPDRVVAELSAPTRLEAWPAPAPPTPIPGGWLQIEVTEDDREILDAAFDTWLEAEPDLDAEQLAGRAQELRLPVAPFRPLPSESTRPTSMPHQTSGPPALTRTRRPTRHPRVVDLSTLWAGPLATALLAEAGAEVVKIDPRCRPDGFGQRPNLYRHLNEAKEIIDLDLRHEADRRRFERLVAEADVLVESFSRRVLPNLGYDHRTLWSLNTELAVVSIRGFGAAQPEADWLAYGPGVHAASGLGWRGSDVEPQPASVAYPDVITGLNVFAQVGRSLVHQPGPTAIEVTLADSIEPLVAAAVEAAAMVGTEPRTSDG